MSEILSTQERHEAFVLVFCSLHRVVDIDKFHTTLRYLAVFKRRLSPNFG